MPRIAVIGAGITGVTTAYALVERGFDVTVFDRHRYPAMETSFVKSRCDAVALGSNISVAAPFVRRCLTGSTMAPFPHPAHRTGQADFPHPALGQNFTPSPTARRAQACSGVRAQSARKDARVDRSHPCDAWFCA
jgi:glycine/D-amino acid oxidase-like deaminating enzyme